MQLHQKLSVFDIGSHFEWKSQWWESNRYLDDSIIGRAFNRMSRLPEVGGAFSQYCPLQFEFQVWCSSFTCFWRLYITFQM